MAHEWRDAPGVCRPADRHGISLPKFDYWVRQFGLTKARASRVAPGFAAVEVVPPAVGSGVIEVVLARGDRVVVHAGAEITLVRTVLSAFVRC